MSGNRSAWMWPIGSPCGQAARMPASAHSSSVARPGLHLVRPRARPLQQRRPAVRPQRVAPRRRIVAAGDVQRRQRGTHRPAMLRPHPARPDARQERGDRGMPPAQMPQRHAVAPVHRQGADDAALRQMLHQPEEPGQLRRIHALLVQGQDVVARRGAQRVVAVLHPLGDAAERHHAADVVVRQEGGERLVGDLGIDRHARLRSRRQEGRKCWPPRQLSTGTATRTMPAPRSPATSP